MGHCRDLREGPFRAGDHRRVSLHVNSFMPEFTPPYSIELLSPVAPQTNLAVECDCFVADILNNRDAMQTNGQLTPTPLRSLVNEHRNCLEMFRLLCLQVE